MRTHTHTHTHTHTLSLSPPHTHARTHTHTTGKKRLSICLSVYCVFGLYHVYCRVLKGKKRMSFCLNVCYVFGLYQVYWRVLKGKKHMSFCVSTCCAFGPSYISCTEANDASFRDQLEFLRQYVSSCVFGPSTRCSLYRVPEIQLVRADPSLCVSACCVSDPACVPCTEGQNACTAQLQCLCQYNVFCVRVVHRVLHVLKRYN